jgi:hypothetical protein
MPAFNKKSITQSHDPGVVCWFETVSKAALADLVIDLARRNYGEDDQLDGVELLKQVRSDAEAVFRAREDRLPETHEWETSTARWMKRFSATDRARSSSVQGACEQLDRWRPGWRDQEPLFRDVKS